MAAPCENVALASRIDMATDLWQTRTEALAYLAEKHPSRLAVINKTFELLDMCVDAYEAAASSDDYALVCGITLVKAKMLAVGTYSLMLDGLAQEGGALLRPLLEYTEKLTYFRLEPSAVGKALIDDLPSAGEIAMKIAGVYKKLRDHLNEHAAHSSFSDYSLSHLRDPATLRFKKSQRMVPQVLDKNLTDLAIHMHLLALEAAKSLESVKPVNWLEIGEATDRLKARMLDVFGL